MNRRMRVMLLLLAVCCVIGMPGKATGLTVQLSLSQFTGDSASATIDLSDEGGMITGQINVLANPNIGDLRAVFLQVIDESILPGLTITGPMVSDTAIGDDDITSVGNATVNGDGNPGPFDIGIAFGSPGIGGDDIQSTTFFLNHAANDLSLSLFDLSRWGLRMTSVGEPGGSREGSSKLSVVEIRPTGLVPPTGNDFPTPNNEPELPTPGIAPIPEPGTAVFTLITGVFAAFWWRSRRRSVA